jgi:predicted MFS family arabinose efflux permease
MLMALGAIILQLSHWRVSFWVVTAFVLAMTLAVLGSSSRNRRPPQSPSKSGRLPT